jgi:Uma2 family endonuclease
MTVAKSPQFRSFEEYLAANPSDLPEGRYEYWDGELVAVMSESGLNDDIANYLYFLLVSAGIWSKLVKPHSCEIEVIGKPRTRFPDLTILDEAHVALTEKRNTITRDMPPPRLLVEVVSPGNPDSANYKRDYEEKAKQYAAIEVPEYWLIDPNRGVILVGQLANRKYHYVRFQGNQPIVSPTFPGLKLTAEQVLTMGR